MLPDNLITSLQYLSERGLKLDKDLNNFSQIKMKDKVSFKHLLNVLEWLNKGENIEDSVRGMGSNLTDIYKYIHDKHNEVIHYLLANKSDVLEKASAELERSNKDGQLSQESQEKLDELNKLGDELKGCVIEALKKGMLSCKDNYQLNKVVDEIKYKNDLKGKIILESISVNDLIDTLVKKNIIVELNNCQLLANQRPLNEKLFNYAINNKIQFNGLRLDDLSHEIRVEDLIQTIQKGTIITLTSPKSIDPSKVQKISQLKNAGFTLSYYFPDELVLTEFRSALPQDFTIKSYPFIDEVKDALKDFIHEDVTTSSITFKNSDLTKDIADILKEWLDTKNTYSDKTIKFTGMTEKNFSDEFLDTIKNCKNCSLHFEDSVINSDVARKLSELPASTRYNKITLKDYDGSKEDNVIKGIFLQNIDSFYNCTLRQEDITAIDTANVYRDHTFRNVILYKCDIFGDKTNKAILYNCKNITFESCDLNGICKLSMRDKSNITFKNYENFEVDSLEKILSDAKRNRDKPNIIFDNCVFTASIIEMLKNVELGNFNEKTLDITLKNPTFKAMEFKNVKDLNKHTADVKISNSLKLQDCTFSKEGIEILRLKEVPVIYENMTLKECDIINISFEEVSGTITLDKCSVNEAVIKALSKSEVMLKDNQNILKNPEIILKNMILGEPWGTLLVDERLELEGQEKSVEKKLTTKLTFANCTLTSEFLNECIKKDNITYVNVTLDGPTTEQIKAFIEKNPNVRITLKNCKIDDELAHNKNIIIGENVETPAQTAAQISSPPIVEAEVVNAAPAQINDNKVEKVYKNVKDFINVYYLKTDINTESIDLDNLIRKSGDKKAGDKLNELLKRSHPAAYQVRKYDPENVKNVTKQRVEGRKEPVENKKELNPPLVAKAWIEIDKAIKANENDGKSALNKITDLYAILWEQKYALGQAKNYEFIGKGNPLRAINYGLTNLKEPLNKKETHDNEIINAVKLGRAKGDFAIFKKYAAEELQKIIGEGIKITKGHAAIKARGEAASALMNEINGWKIDNAEKFYTELYKLLKDSQDTLRGTASLDTKTQYGKGGMYDQALTNLRNKLYELAQNNDRVGIKIEHQVIEVVGEKNISLKEMHKTSFSTSVARFFRYIHKEDKKVTNAEEKPEPPKPNTD